MRRLLLVACSLAVTACAHHEPRNLAQRQQKTPRSDFDGAHRGDRRDRASPPVEPPSVTPPIR